MTEIQQNRWDQLVRRVANIVGGGSQVNDTLNELFPIIDVENMQPELFALSGTALAFGGGTIGSTAGQTGRMQVFNPVGSGAILTLTKVVIAHSATAATIRWSIVNATLSGGIGTQTFRDTRLGLAGSSLPVGQIFSATEVALVDGIGQARTLANVALKLEDANGIAVLLPGSGFSIGIDATNTPVFVTFYWKERATQASETNF